MGPLRGRLRRGRGRRGRGWGRRGRGWGRRRQQRQTLCLPLADARRLRRLLPRPLRRRRCRRGGRGRRRSRQEGQSLRGLMLAAFCLRLHRHRCRRRGWPAL